MKFAAADAETIKEAAAELDGVALELRTTHCMPPAYDDWGSDLDVKESHDKTKVLVGKLYDMAERMEKDFPPVKPKVRKSKTTINSVQPWPFPTKP